MKVLMVNGSPKSKGNTAAALAEVGAVLEDHGIEWGGVSAGCFCSA